MSFRTWTGDALRMTAAAFVFMGSLAAHAAAPTLTPVPIPGPFPLPPRVPLAPSIEAPLSGNPGELGNTYPTLRWTHGGLTVNPNAATNYFIICLQVQSPFQPCTFANANWSGTPVSF